MKSDDALATILLVSRIASDGTRPLTARQFWKLANDLGRPGSLLEMTEDDLKGTGLAADMASRVASLLARATAMAFQLERLDQSGISTLTPFDDLYPQRLRTSLGSKAPAILHAAGALELLDEGGVGVVGSRNVSNEGARVAEALGEKAASLGIPLISGAARGVDQLAMNAAFESGGDVIGSPAHSLSRTLRSPGVRRAVYEGRTVICTPYAPDSGFSVGKAMGRNKLIYALSDVTVAVAADKGSGGTWSGATEAMKGRYCRVAVWRGNGEGPGNEALADMGATPITDVSQLRGILDSPRSESEESPQAEQVALF
ncbi:MAG: DNA-processing protein DprA [bacterium]|nr:DNA-processing protein DprA [bacterium]